MDIHEEEERSKDFEEAVDIISNILCEDPRSVYRRNHCKDQLYYFTYHIFHITCWVDEVESSFEVVRVLKCTTLSEEKKRNTERIYR